VTVGWNIVEGIVAISAAVGAGSVALLGFGFDSFIESISGSVLIWRLQIEARGGVDEDRIEEVERRAERLVGVSFFVVAAYVVYEAIGVLIGHEPPSASPIGIALTSVSVVVMLWLARAKRETGEALGSRALSADSFQTFACVLLSLATLAGLLLNAVAGLWWADPIAGLGIAAILVREGREVWIGEGHG
jgi:divalent metal cation (Fe/Co/Zn/Cd) transporter